MICAGQGKFIPSCVDGTGAAFWNQRISFTLEEAREGQGKKQTGAHVRFLEILRRRNAFCPSSRQQQQQQKQQNPWAATQKFCL